MKKDSIVRGAWQDYKKYFNSLSLPLVFFYIVSGIVFAIYGITGGSLLIYALLLIVPFFFALQAICVTVKAGQDVGAGWAFPLALHYYRAPFIGVYRVIISCLKTFIPLALSVGIVYWCFLFSNSEFQQLVLSLNEVMTDVNATSEQLNEIINSELFVNFAYVLSMVCYGVGALSLLYFITFNSLNFYLRGKVSTANSRVANYIYGRSLSGNRGYVYKNHIALAWPIFLVFAIGYTVGCLIGYFYLPTLASSIAVGFGLGFLLMLPFLCPFFFGMERVYKGLEPKVMNTITEVLAQSIRDMEQSAAFTDEQIKEAKQAMEDLKKDNEENAKNDEDKKDDDDDIIHHDPSEYV